jgi:hypothetical protein
VSKAPAVIFFYQRFFVRGINLEAEKVINYYHQYFMLLGITEFTRVYIQINPIQFVNLFKLSQNLGMGNDEVAELLKIANGYLPRVRLEYDRLQEQKRLSEAELNSRKAELSNTVRIYQQFCDHNLDLKKREDELQLSINGLETKENELQRTISDSNSSYQNFRNSM